MAVLANSSTSDFPLLRDHLEVSDSDLSKQMSALEAAGYVEVRKLRGPGGVTTYRITEKGRLAFERHVAALQAIVTQPISPPAR